MRTAIRLLVGFAAVASVASAAYTPYFTDTMASYQSSYWTENGSLSFGSQNGYPTQTGIATLVSKVAIPDGTSSYEVKETLHNVLYGNYKLLLRASSNADAYHCTGSPSYYSGAFAFAYSYPSPVATFTLTKCVSGTSTTLGSTNIPLLADGTTIRMMINDNGVIAAYVNDGLVFNTTDHSITTGSPGVAFDGYSSSLSSATNVLLAPADRVAPVSLPTVTVSAYSTHVDFNVSGSAQDDANGVGIALLSWYRDISWTNNNSGTWSDTTVQPGTEYTYTLTAFDRHWNTLSTTFDVVTPNAPAGSPNPPDGRETGVRTTGTYWGAGNEQIDVLSGNVNFTVPLVKAVGRNGLTAAFNLTYNSQNWRSDSGGLWNLGADVGYGYGWKLLAGAVTPVYTGGTLSYYSYYDSTGASYRLNVNNGGVWNSLESVYVWLDTNVNPYKLHFRDGTFWILGSTSASGEADAGSLYPTTMESTDGNQILITYQQGAGGSTTNTSARISNIRDVRGSAQFGSFQFSYTSLNGVNHLTGVANTIGTAEAYTLNYSAVTVQAPFSPYTSYGTTETLGTVTTTGLGQQYSFTYNSDNSGTLTYAYLPYGGYLRWDYNNVTYTNGATYRQVQTRYLSKDGVNTTSYPFSHEASTQNLHSFTIIDDPGGVGEKYWAFSLSGANTSMVTQYQGRQLPGPVTLTQNDFTWAQDANGNLFIRSALTTQDPGQSYQAQKKTDQNVDVYGNVTQVFQFDFSSLTTPARVYTYTYLNNSNYTSRYIFNRVTQATLIDQTQQVQTLVTNTYDLTFSTAPSGISLWDNTYASVTYRGDVATSTTPAATRSNSYDATGTVTKAVVNGVTTNVTSSSSNNYAVPSQISVGSLSESMNWSSFLGLTSATGPNGDNSTITYDSYGRPQTSKSAFGAQTTYTYSTGPYSASNVAWSKSTINGRFTKTTLDGLGRTITVQSGTGSTVVSQVDTVYGSCGCSPTGKMIQTTLPHAPNGTPVWTTNSYDGIGRTVSVLSPDGASTSRYFYAGNTVTTTDAAGKWKTYAMDAFGNVTLVTEPDPTTSVTAVNAIAAASGLSNSNLATYPATGSGGGGGQVATPTFSQNGATLTISDATSGATIYYTTDGSTPTTSSPVYSGPVSLSTSTYGTTYTYDMFNHLIKVTMPRPSGTQTRTFVYSGNDLTSATNPENGTVTYTYDSNHRVLTKTDAKSQQTVYTYDGDGHDGTTYGRVIQVQNPTQTVVYSYDSNPYDSTYSQYAAGRLAAVQYAGGNCTFEHGQPSSCDTIQEMYTYNQAGDGSTGGINGAAMTGKRVRLVRGSIHADLNATWTYDSEGRVTNVTYPSWNASSTSTVPGSSYSYAFDTMGRLNTMTDSVNTATLISGVTYGVANEVQAITGSFFTETRSYNSLFQLAQITVSGALNVQYAYSSTMNNGKAISQTDVISGEQVVYTYDALNRLATAQTMQTGGTQWGQSYNYDGFGNLTDQNVIKGSAPTMHVTYNAATNRQTGDTADANGNLGTGGSSPNIYDAANRLLQPGGTTVEYAYAPDNKRMWKGGTVGDGTGEVDFWSPNGQKLAGYSVFTWTSSGTQHLGFSLQATDAYFGVRLIAKATSTESCQQHIDCVTLASVATDRLSSIGKFYPYGQERPSATQNDTEKFTGYYRDAATGLDYSDQRYHQPGVGRFMTADPYQASGGPSDPGSWNRYAYTRGDPVNRLDPTGEDDCPPTTFGYCASSPAGTPFTGFGGDPGGAGSSDGTGIDLQQRVNGARDRARFNKVLKELPTAIGVAEKALQDPKCAALFGQGKLPDGSVVTGATLLFDLFNHIMGSIQPMELPVTTTIVNGVPKTTAVNAQTSLNNGQIEIDISDVAGSFVTGNAQDQAITLLHEIGHAMNDLFGNGTSGILSDDDPKINTGNTNKVIKDCFPNLPLLPLP